MPTSKLLQNDGWNACVDASLCRARDSWKDSPAFRSHGHVLRRVFSDPQLAFDAVLCVDQRPTVCIKDGRHLSDAEVNALRKNLWNLGATTLLMVERKNCIQLFSTLAEPARPTTHDAVSPLLDDETIVNLEAGELALRLRQLIRRVESGAIYRGHKALFDAKNAVDQVLLGNLKVLRDLICPDRTVDSFKRAHALIGRFLFSCYLLDRGIIGDAYLRKYDLIPASDMLAFLDGHVSDGAAALEKLFGALQRDFNGSLFGEQNTTVSVNEVAYLRRFLSGEDLSTGQTSMFKLYDFSFVPVELISSIYQEFLGAESEIEAQATGRNQLRNTGQRKLGAYYTPPRLAELTVDIGTDGWNTLLDKNCLDPACGSGVFLVILFVRMAEEWRSRNPKADAKHRYNELMRLLEVNLRGVDVNLTACLVTCFSLYLALLDQMQPKEILDLREALEHDPRKKILPRILWNKGDDRPPQPPRLHTVREADFFELPAAKSFDLVIGNPPWVSRKDLPSTKSVKAWLFPKKNEESNFFAKDVRPSMVTQTLFPEKEVACAFMWKAGLHVKPGGRVCQVLPSRVFLSNNTDRFQTHWIKHHRLETVWLLADYRRVLFEGAICPCFVGRYHPRLENEPLGEFEFVTPKVELLDPREAIIPVQPEDQKVLSEKDIVAAAEKAECALAWKKQHWGTPRDLKLIERLMQLPKLDALCARPPRMKRDTPGTRAAENKKQWWKGQGFQPLTDGDIVEPEGNDENNSSWPIWWNEKFPFLAAENAPTGYFLDHANAYGSRPKLVRRTIAPELCRAPLLLINQACTKFLFSDFDVLFQHDFQAICAPKSEEDELLFLTAVIASPLAQYLLFHTSANIGIERDKAHLEELLALPFPLPNEMRDKNNSQTIVQKCALILRTLKVDLLAPENQLRRAPLVASAQKKLNALVYSYFGICAWERYLIEDTVAIFRPSSTPSSLDAPKLFTVKSSNEKDRKDYAHVLLSTFKGWTRSKSSLWVTVNVAERAELAVMTFGVGGRKSGFSEVKAEERVEQLLLRIRESSAHVPGTVFQCLRGFAFFEGKQVHVVKPLNRRHWTRTAALNDADEIVSYMMKEDGWGA